jgi:DNA-binding PadR family transcriptional regulator
LDDFDYRRINSILHSRIRLAIVSLLAGCESAEFTFIKKNTGATDGNINSHMKKMEEEGYVKVTKEFQNRKPVTHYSLTADGRKALEEYVKQLSGFLRIGED